MCHSVFGRSQDLSGRFNGYFIIIYYLFSETAAISVRIQDVSGRLQDDSWIFENF